MHVTRPLVYKFMGHTLVLVILIYRDSGIVACEELALGLEFIEFATGWGRRNQGDEERK